ncbi:uncharacterized protein [Oryctolagus cuniculus]|uniref:uncharacterized protein isoform X3 n=1 Tax=Oryctolagus cuniculus TaxID=9986 RepID=UPI003879C60A
MWGRSRQVGGTGLPRRVPWTMWLSSQWAPVCRACIQLSHFSCCAGHQCQMCLVVSLCLSMGSRLSIGSAGTRWGNEAGSKSSRDVGAKSGSRRPLDLGSLEDTWMPGWGWRIIPEGRGGELGGGCPSPPVPSPCALEESSSWDPATRYLLACLCGCPLRPWGQTSGQQFPWAPHAGSQVCVSYRLDMDTLRSGRAQERAVIIMKYEKGPRKGAQFQLGEEGEENGVLVPDRFGFLHKQKLPRHGWLAVQWLSCPQAPELHLWPLSEDTAGLTPSCLHSRRKHQEGRRLQKWNKMLRNFTKYHSSKKFHLRIEKGIPAQVRGKMWAMMLSVDNRRAQNPGKFETTLLIRGAPGIFDVQPREYSGITFHVHIQSCPCRVLWSQRSQPVLRGPL